MFRNLFDDMEEGFDAILGKVRDKINESAKEFQGLSPDERKEKFVNWGRDYVSKLNESKVSQSAEKAKESFFSLIRLLGLNEDLLKQTFAQNKREVLEPVFGEFLAVLTLILGWKKQDKEAFSQALGEIGVFGLLAAKPFVLLIAVCGLAWGYQKTFNANAFKKGGLIGLSGMTAAMLAPGAFVGLLAAVVVVVYLNKKIDVQKPVEAQVKEIVKSICNGEIIKEARESWKKFEAWLEELFTQQEEPPVNESPQLMQ